MNRISTFCFALLSATACAEEPLSSNDTIRLQLGPKQALEFRRVSPATYEIDYPDFYVLESEVTNSQFLTYLAATKQTKDDTDVLTTIKDRDKRNFFSTGDIPYRIEDESTIWRDGAFPDGMEDHPVALVTLHDASGFAKWVSSTHSDVGLIRLPTWNEWMVAAYGNKRHYPWGNEWDTKRLHSSYGYKWDIDVFGDGEETKDHPQRTEPVRARQNGRTPEGIFGMLGNVGEYIVSKDPTNTSYFNLGSRSMGGGFTTGLTMFGDEPTRLRPRTDYWGFSHHATQRKCDIGFRLILDPTSDLELLKRPRLFKQNNRAWMIESKGVESKPTQKEAVNNDMHGRTACGVCSNGKSTLRPP